MDLNDQTQMITQQNEDCKNQKHELDKVNNLLKIQIRLFQQSNQEAEHLRKENILMKNKISNLEELSSKAIYENEQLKKSFNGFDQFLEMKKRYNKATELIAELWIENQKLKELVQEKD